MINYFYCTRMYVCRSALTQSLKGLVTAGVYKSGEYILQKLSKSLLKPLFS